MSYWNGWITDATPQRMKWVTWEGDAGPSRRVEPSDEIIKLVPAAPTPEEDALESLISEGGEDRPHHGVMDLDGDIDIAGTIVPVFWSWPKRQSWEHEGVHAIELSCLARCGVHQLLSEPGIEVDREMRPLLLGTPGRHNSDGTCLYSTPNLLVCQIAVGCAPT